MSARTDGRDNDKRALLRRLGALVQRRRGRLQLLLADKRWDEAHELLTLLVQAEIGQFLELSLAKVGVSQSLFRCLCLAWRSAVREGLPSYRQVASLPRHLVSAVQESTARELFRLEDSMAWLYVVSQWGDEIEAYLRELLIDEAAASEVYRQFLRGHSSLKVPVAYSSIRVAIFALAHKLAAAPVEHEARVLTEHDFTIAEQAEVLARPVGEATFLLSQTADRLQQMIRHRHNRALINSVVVMLLKVDRVSEAYTLVYEQFGPEIRGYFRGMTSSAEDGDDLYQSLCALLVTQLHRFEGRSSLRVWLFRIAHNMIVKWFHRYSHRNKVRLDTDMEQRLPGHGGAVDALGGSADLQHEVRRQIVSEALERLRPQERVILILRSEKGMSYAEAASVLKISEANARKRYERAKQRLQDYIHHRDNHHLHQTAEHDNG